MKMFFPALMIFLWIDICCADNPVISYVHVIQDKIKINDSSCTGIIDIDIQHSTDDSLLLSIQISADNGTSWMVPLQTDFFVKITPGMHSIPFSVPGRYGDSCRVKVTVYDSLLANNNERLIPAASHAFLMGSDNGRPEERPKHTVTFSHDFWIDTVEISEAEFKLFKPDYAPQYLSQFVYESNRPVDNCYWHWAIRYCNWRSKQDKLDTCYTNFPYESENISDYFQVHCNPEKNGYRLPSEAEWEYACRAGSMTDYFWGDDSSRAVAGKYCWYWYNASDTIHGPGIKIPNKFGIHDMSGGMMELCNDWYDTSYYSISPVLNPQGPLTFAYGSKDDPFRVTRGGYFLSTPESITSSTRIGNFSSARHPQSFRCVRTVLP